MATATPALCTGVVKRGATSQRRRERDACHNTGVDGATLMSLNGGVGKRFEERTAP